MTSRRSVLALMTSLLGLPLARPAAAFVAPNPEIHRFGQHYLVNGWVLTARDLRLLGLRVG